MLKTYRLAEILPETITTQFDFAVTYKDVTYTVFNSAFFVSELEHHFSDRYISLHESDNPDTALVALFTLWKTNRAANYARRMYALNVDYEPLNNYDRTETRDGSSKTTHGESITRTHLNTDTRTHNNTDTTTYSGTETEIKDLYGVNSVVGVPSDVNTKSFTQRTDADAHTGTITDAHTGTITDAHSGKDSTEDGYELRAYGNIGVTTSATMLLEDQNLIYHDIALLAVCDFMDRYTWALEGIKL